MEREMIDQNPDFRLVGRAKSIDDAEQIARQYEAQGFMTKIVRKTMGEVSLYEVWAGKEPDIIT